jgi:methylated-DNA-[protein]-cysteine S-methyltransferase
MSTNVDALLASFAARAEAEGVVDVAYTWADSPIGPLLLASTVVGLVRVGFGSTEDADLVLQQLADRVSPRVLESPARLDEVRRELDEYFEGRRSSFDVPLDWRLASPGFRRRALEAIAHIPYGSVRTYREIAVEAGNPNAVRAAGTACGSNPIPVVVPCHRVLRTGGGLGGYGGGIDKKVRLLSLEGVSLEIG